MADDYELTWKRNPETGHWLAHDNRDGATYVAARNTRSAPGRQWTISVFVPGGAQQTRDGFSTLATAKAAALETRCHLCGQHLPFATMEPSGGMDGWRCRDHGDCARVSAARDAEIEQFRREGRNTDMDEIGVTDTADGPELVFTRDHHSTVTWCTETDLDRLFRVLARRKRDRAMADIRSMIAECDVTLAAHEEREAGS